MLDVESAKETFRHHLRENGQRYTPERELILETVLGTEHHFSAETLAHEIKRLKGEVSLATVYRTLPVLVSCGFVQPTVKQGDVDFYERRRDDEHHDHLLCVHCGQIVEFFNPVIELEQEKIAETHGFKLTNHSLVLKGECPRCRQ